MVATLFYILSRDHEIIMSLSGDPVIMRSLFRDLEITKYNKRRVANMAALISCTYGWGQGVQVFLDECIGDILSVTEGK